MGSESASPSRDDRDEDDDDESEETGGGSQMLGFMFGNVDASGKLEVDYLSQEAKENLDAVADKLGPSLTDINLSGKSSWTPAAVEDYNEKDEDAVDYEDIEEQYEGPEIVAATEEDHLMPKRDFLPIDVSATNLGSSVFDDENYDEDEAEEKTAEAVVHECEVGTRNPSGLILTPGDADKTELVQKNSVHQGGNAVSVEQLENDVAVVDGGITSGVDTIDYPAGFEDLVEVFTKPKEERGEGLSCLEEQSLSHKAVDTRSTTSLPVLCMENGMTILRFSEIFGVNEPLKRIGGREHKYSFSKDKYTSVNASFTVEENEEAFLRGSCHVFSAEKPSVETQAGSKMFLDDHSELSKLDSCSGMRVRHDESTDTCLSAESMRKESIFEFSVEWQSYTSKEFYSLDQQDWEDGVVWGNSPMVSENSLEGCELSEHDSHGEREINSKLDYVSHDNKILMNEKDSRNLHALSASSVEPFDLRDSATTNDYCSESLHHPQLLRLESRSVMSFPNLSARKELASNENHDIEVMKRFKQFTLQNKDLVEGSWIENIIWDSEKPFAKSKLILDLQDEQMVFEILDNKNYEHLHAHARALITPRSGIVNSDVFDLPSRVALSGRQFNIANDKFYSDRRVSPQLKSLSKKRAAHGVKILHSVPALTLETMKPRLSNKELANFHRPKAIWYPHDNEVASKELGKLPKQGPMKVILKSLGGKGIKIYVDAEETVSTLKAKASKKLDFTITEAVKIYHVGKQLDDDKTLAEQNIQHNILLHLVYTRIHLLPKAQKLSNEKKSLRPPGAFKKKSELSARDGHILLMEYCEERPLLLGNVGMGARLYTYYQKASSDDQNGELLRNANTCLGTVVTLDTGDKSPFVGEIKPGCSQSSLETEMFKAPVFPHRVTSTDYLLVRSPKGKLSLRRIDKIHVVGQQEPMIEVMSPGSKNPQNYLWNRLLVYMYREFRAAVKRNMPPYIRADELSAQFPQIAEPFLRKRLKHCADLQRGPNGRLHWVMRRNFHIPPDEELRKMVKPETVCSYESMQAALYHLKRLGISRLAHLTSPTQIGTISTAMNQLPDEAIALAAASHIEREMQITPWNLSANFVTCIGQDKGNVERLEISGVGDPSGRGFGFSYVRIPSKPPTANAHAKKKPVVARGSTLTGTDADLRRLSMGAAREVLMKFNVSEQHIAKLSRWHRIAMIRKLSSEQAASGAEVDPTTISKYARGQRMSFLQLQQRTREKCQDIWYRQIQSLLAVDGNENESDSEANSDLDSFAGDLENLLDAEEGEEGDEGTPEIKNCKSEVVKGLKVRRHPPQIRLEEQMEDESVEVAELCRMLMDGDGAKWKKKKLRPNGESSGLIRGPERSFAIENSPQVTRPSTLIKHTNGNAVNNDILITNTNGDVKVVENLHSKKSVFKKMKGGVTNEVVPVDLLNKKIKITSDVMDVNTRKPARESFVCGACHQFGHMRTNKNCPKFKEDPETQMNSTDGENEFGKSTSQDTIQSQQKNSAMKLIPTSTSNVAQVDGSEGGKSTMKAKILKVKYASEEKAASVSEFNSEQPSTSNAEVVNKPVPKVLKIVGNKKKSDDVQIEPQKLNVVIRPPSETNREQLFKKITIKQPKKEQEVINLDQISEEGVDFEFRKTKKMTDLSVLSSGVHERTPELSRKNKADRRMWEEEEKRRNAERIKQEQARRFYEEEMRMQEEQEKLAELRKYEEDIRREREEELHKASRKMKKKRPGEIRDDYFEEFQVQRNNRKLPGKSRSAKRKTTVKLGSYGAEHVPASKRRKGGEVGLANILEEILDILKANIQVSYLFQKPVSKKEAPDYLDIIKHPMDLSTIREKARRLEYKKRDEFRHDVWQITYNAHVYNDGRNPGIPPLADQLLEISDYLLDQRADRLYEAEAGMEDD